MYFQKMKNNFKYLQKMQILFVIIICENEKKTKNQKKYEKNLLIIKKNVIFAA